MNSVRCRAQGAAKNEIDMINGSLPRGILRFAVPAMLTNILQLLFNACDMVVVGRFAGSSALAAVGATSSLINLLVNFFIGLSIGANVVVARVLGAGEKSQASRVVHTAVAMSLLCGVLLGGLGVSTCRFFLMSMNTPADVLDQSVLYMRLYFLGAPAMLLYNFGSAVLRARGNTRHPLIFLAIGGIVNVVLNLILVIVFHMAVDGVALATLASQVVSAVLVVWYLTNEQGACRLHWRRLHIDFPAMKEILRTGIPAGLGSMVFSVANMQIQAAVNGFGSAAVAGCAASGSLEGFAYATVYAMEQTSLNFVSQNLGARRIDRIPKVVRVCLLYTAALTIGVGGTEFLLGRQLLSIYTTDPAAIEAGMIRLTIFMLSYLLCGTMDVSASIMRGLGYSMLPTLVTFVGACGFRLLWIRFVFPLHPTLQLLFASYPISWAITAAVHQCCYRAALRKIRRNLAADAPCAAD